MRIGALLFPTDLSIRPDRLAAELEARGFESLWVTEHTHIPTSRRTPWPGGPQLPEEYRRTLDPFVALMAAGAVTERLLLATGITLVAQHDPIVQAKTVATLDHLTGGRVLLGIGVGWNLEEMEDHGVDPAQRRESPASTSSRCASCGPATRRRSTVSTCRSDRRGAGRSRSASHIRRSSWAARAGR